MGYEEHKQLSRETPVRCAVLTVSDTRTEKTDASGALIKQRLERAGHSLVAYHVVPDEAGTIRTLLAQLAHGRAEAILLNGGTGISRRDRTFEAVSALLEKTLPGFGELFRMLSYNHVGAGAMLSRAVAGIYGSAVLFSMPGSPNAVELAMDKLILPELNHLVWELLRQAD